MRESDLPNENFHGTFRRLMKVGGFFCALGAKFIARKPNEHPNNPPRTVPPPIPLSNGFKSVRF